MCGRARSRTARHFGDDGTGLLIIVPINGIRSRHKDMVD